MHTILSEHRISSSLSPFESVKIPLIKKKLPDPCGSGSFYSIHILLTNREQPAVEPVSRKFQEILHVDNAVSVEVKCRIGPL